MITIKVVDSIMGSGKSSAAINLMNDDQENNYIYITPYLSEGERIKQNCTRKFYEPKVYSKHGETFYKLDSLHELLSNNKNIATTHALFKMATDETKELIYSGNYILILDEVMEVVKQLEISPKDVQMLINSQWIINDNGRILWNHEKEQKEGEYDGEFQIVKKLAQNNNLILHRDRILIWEFPSDIFRLFKDTYILTYMFESTLQYYYFKMNNIEYEKYISVYENGKYIFKKNEGYTDHHIREELKKKIHIYEGNLNKIGDDEYALSKNWYETKKHMHKQLKNNILNYFQHKMKSKSEFNMWTTYKDYMHKLKGKGYTNGFLSSTARSMNEFSHKTTLAYAINRYVHPVIKDYFNSKGIQIDEDLYALSEAIQWIWRSAIRNGQEINIYIPSRRMRTLLIKWLNCEI